MVRLKLSIGRTVNMGNYQSLRIDAGLEDDVNPEIKDEWMREAQLWIESKIAGIIADHVDVSIDEAEVEEMLKDVGKVTKPSE